MLMCAITRVAFYHLRWHDLDFFEHSTIRPHPSIQTWCKNTEENGHLSRHPWLLVLLLGGNINVWCNMEPWTMDIMMNVFPASNCSVINRHRGIKKTVRDSNFHRLILVFQTKVIASPYRLLWSYDRGVSITISICRFLSRYFDQWLWICCVTTLMKASRIYLTKFFNSIRTELIHSWI
jgi:hypothetical protein